jgi:hypothetical protein
LLGLESEPFINYKNSFHKKLEKICHLGFLNDSKKDYDIGFSRKTHAIFFDENGLKLTKSVDENVHNIDPRSGCT